MRKFIAAGILIILIFTFVGSRPPLRRDIEPQTDQPRGMTSENGATKAEKIENMLEGEIGLQNVVVVIRGQEVFVGIDLDYNQNYGGNVVQRIDEMIRSDKKYTYVYITNEKTTVESLRFIRDEVDRGVEVENYNNELNTIRDLMTI